LASGFKQRGHAAQHEAMLTGAVRRSSAFPAHVARLALALVC
jgi:hypothetical protein